MTITPGQIITNTLSFELLDHFKQKVNMNFVR